MVIRPTSTRTQKPTTTHRPPVSTAPDLSVDGETPSRSTATRPSRSATATDRRLVVAGELAFDVGGGVLVQLVPRTHPGGEHGPCYWQWKNSLALRVH
jgi:hypothetical protein